MIQKILFDTDIGSDIDDAVCLAYLLANPNCELLGITTVTGEAEARAKLASVLCHIAGQKIPIYPGVVRPLLIPQKQPHAPQAAALGNWPHQSNFPQHQTIPFLQDIIRNNPGEITLLTVGPLTNIALLFASDPEIPSLLKALVMMCGVFTNQLSGVGPLEWNAMLDPHATAIVYQHQCAIHRSIGLDVTCQVTMTAQNVRSRFQAPLLKPVLDFAEIWFKNQDRITFHDPLAATTIFDPAICTFQRGQVEVGFQNAQLMGVTQWKPEDDGSHEVAIQVNSKQFGEHFFSFF